MGLEDGRILVKRQDGRPIGTAYGYEAARLVQEHFVNAAFAESIGKHMQVNQVPDVRDEPPEASDPATAARRALVGHRGPVYCVSFSWDHRWLVSGSQDGDIRMWDLASGRCVAVYKGHSGPVWAVQHLHMGTSAWFASASSDRTARIWRTDSTSPVRLLVGHVGDVEVRGHSDP